VTASGLLVSRITPGGVVTTLAGTLFVHGSADGTGAAAQFNGAGGLAADGAGNVYVADGDNHEIRKISPVGVVTTVAGLAGGFGSADGTGETARFCDPSSLGVDSAGNVYVADTANETIRKISAAGAVTTLAGTVGSSGVADGTGAAGQFSHPAGVAVDDAGTVYVADRYNTMIRKITPGGAVTTLAGSAGTLGNVDGLTRFNFPFGVAVDSTRNVYWADRLNSTIFKIASGGAMAVLAGVYGQYPYGGGSADGAGPAAQFSYPRGVTVDGAGNVYVADTANSTIRKISATGVVTTFAGTAGVIGSADGSGASARFCFPTNVAADSGGNVFVVDSGNSTIRRITPGGIVTTVAGLAGAVGSADGIDAKAQFNNPTGVAVDRAGNLYIADAGNHTIRKGVLMGPPVITTQPQSQTVVPGASVQLFVTASAVPAPAYQWYFNSGVIGGATTSIFSFTNARSADAGDYTVVVTNSLGSATSAKATLTVSATQVAAAQMAAPASGGGGSVEAWFALALLAVAAVRGARRTRQA
jgi:preprotein translocase subunit YajC